MKKAITWAFGFFCLGSVEAIYRPFDIHYPGARSAGAGATGVSSIDSLGSLPMNPAYLADIHKPAIALGLDAQTRIQRVQAEFYMAPQYLPIVSWGTPLGPNGGLGLLAHSPIQRLFPDSEYILYNLEIAYAHSLMRRLNLAITGGMALGLQAQIYHAFAPCWSLAALYHHDWFDLGMSFRPGITLTYRPYPNGAVVEERTPDVLRLGLSHLWGSVRISFEIEQVSWGSSYFRENQVDITPSFEPGFLHGINPHLGLAFPLPPWPGLTFRTGMYTADFYDFLGRNDRQILLTFGIGGLAGEDIWGERLRIDFSLVSSFLPSLFWPESNRIEKLQMTFEFLY
ncbi:MAG: hypothetical protein NZM25_09555 [Leptospiraceae bacterium]|nr:hypothetical protein [Leptospiraceae bacterium]MDW8306403.1 hypothetical protein [Leptospiraceae bacterium]